MSWSLDWKQSGMSLGISILALLTMTAVGAALLNNEMLGMKWANYWAALVLLVSSFAGAATMHSSENKWIGSLVNGVCLWLFLLAVNALEFDGKLGGAGATALAILGGSGSAILLNRGGRRRVSRRRKRHHR